MLGLVSGSGVKECKTCLNVPLLWVAVLVLVRLTVVESTVRLRNGMFRCLVIWVVTVVLLVLHRLKKAMTSSGVLLGTGVLRAGGLTAFLV